MATLIPMDLVARWRARADDLRPYAHGAAAAFEQAAAELEEVLQAARLEALTLAQAAAESSYSRDYLSRLVRAGTIPNAGRPHAPRILRRDLPRKAGCLPPPGPSATLGGATPRQIARAVVNSQPREAR